MAEEGDDNKGRGEGEVERARYVAGDCCGRCERVLAPCPFGLGACVLEGLEVRSLWKERGGEGGSVRVGGVQSRRVTEAGVGGGEVQQDRVALVETELDQARAE